MKIVYLNKKITNKFRIGHLYKFNDKYCIKPIIFIVTGKKYISHYWLIGVLEEVLTFIILSGKRETNLTYIESCNKYFIKTCIGLC